MKDRSFFDSMLDELVEQLEAEERQTRKSDAMEQAFLRITSDLPDNFVESVVSDFNRMATSREAREKFTGRSLTKAVGIALSRAMTNPNYEPLPISEAAATALLRVDTATGGDPVLFFMCRSCGFALDAPILLADVVSFNGQCPACGYSRTDAALGV